MVIPNPDITFHAFADGGVLHLAGSHRLWVLNVTAATLWCLMDGQADARALARDYGSRFGVDDDTARQDVDALLVRFGEWGLLNGSVPQDDKGSREDHPLEPLRAPARLDADLTGLPRIVFSLAGRCFAVTTEDDLAGMWQPLFRHLAAEAKPRGPVAE